MLTGPSTGGKFKPFGLQRGRTRALFPSGASFCLRPDPWKRRFSSHARARPAGLRGLLKNNKRADEGPELPSRSRKTRPTIASRRRLLWKPEISAIPRSARAHAAQQHAGPRPPFNTKTHRTNFYLLLPDPALRYFLTSPLSLRSTVAPGAPPPLHTGPSSGWFCPLPFGKRCGSATAHLSPRRTTPVCLCWFLRGFTSFQAFSLEYSSSLNTFIFVC